MTVTDSPQSRTATADYTTVRTAVGVYPITAPLVRITGDDRLELLDRVLAKAAEFVEPDTVRETLALNADGTPFAILLHLELEEVSWLVPRTPVTADDLQAYLDGIDHEAGDVTVEIAPEGFGAVAFEGPQAWSVAAHFVDFDISGLTLHGVTPVEADGIDNAHLARVGTTGEYGYLIISDAPAAVHETVLSRAAAEGGAAVGPEGLARVQAEAGMALYHGGLGGLSVNDADLAWMVDWQRVGEFHGSSDLEMPTTESAKLAGLVAPAGTRFAPGTEITAGGTAVGVVGWQAPSANPDEELVFAVLDAPFWVPGLDLAATDATGEVHVVRTATQPRVIARSLHVRIS